MDALVREGKTENMYILVRERERETLSHTYTHA